MTGNRLFPGFAFVFLLFTGSFFPAFGQVTVSVGDYLDLDPDEPVWVYVTVDGSSALSGLSFSLNWDPTVACYSALDVNFDLSLGLNNFNLNQTLNGAIGFTYVNLFNPVQPGDTLFAVQLTACGDPGTSTPISISDDPVVIDATGPFVPGGIPPQPVQVLPPAGGQVGFFEIAELPVPTLLLGADGGECLQPGDTQWVCVTVDSVTNFSSLQFSLDWDTFELDFIELDFGQDLGGLSLANFNVDVAGQLGFSWFGFSGSGLKSGDTLFCMQFVVEGALGSEGIISVGDSPLEPAASGLLVGGVFPELEVVPGVGEELTRLSTDLPPQALCKDVTIELPFSGMMAIDPAVLDSGSFDDCQLDTLFTIPDSLFMDDVGVQMIALVAVDSSGSTDTCISNVTVEIPDITGPIAMCKDVTVELDSSGVVVVPADSVDNGTLFNGTLILELKPDSFTCADIGDNMVILGAADDIGADSCQAIVTVEDNIAPVIVCDPIGVDTFVLDAEGQAFPDLEEYENGGMDNCSITFSLDKQVLGCEDFGQGQLILIGTDDAGNADSCAFSIFVLDDTAPEAVCQDLTVALNNQGFGVVDAEMADGGSSDNCDLMFSSLPVQVGCADLGTSALTLIVSDNAGNSSTCIATLTVVDTVPPVAVCQDATVYLDENGTGELQASQLDGNSSDNCGYSVETDLEVYDCEDLGQTFEAVLTVTDAGGSTDTCTSLVSVADSLAPQMICLDDTVYLSEDGLALISATNLDGGSSDNCSDTVLLSLGSDTLTCDMSGLTEVQLFGADESGNTASCIATVLVLDTLVPEATCQNASLYLDETGQAILPASEIDDGSMDNCDLTFSLSRELFTCEDVGNKMLTLYVTDPSGNVDSCTGIVIVFDTISSLDLVCQDVSVFLDSFGMATVAASEFVSSSGDNCPPDYSPDSFIFDCDQIGANVVEITAVNDNGNQDTCEVQAIVEDDIAPQVICKDLTVQLNPNGMYTLLPGQVDGGSTDNCELDLTVSPMVLTTDDIGVISVTLTGTDQSGNTDSCNASVTLVPFGLGPSAICQDITVDLTGNGTVTVPAAAVNNGSLGTGQLFFLLLPSATFNCSDIGPNDVMLVVQDDIGTDTCDAVITVEDNLPPAITCVDGAVVLDSNGLATADIDDFLTLVADNCGLGSTSMSPLDFSCAEVGSNTAEIIAVDAGGNADTCYVEVSVLDTTVPIAQCDSMMVSLDATGTFTPDAEMLGSGSTDNCEDLIFSLSTDVLTCEDLGPQVLTLTVTDQGGNSDSCISLITVEDNEEPVALCQDGNLYLGADGTAMLNPADIDGGSSDNCPVTLSVSQTDFDCDHLGTIPVILTVTDAAGNDAQCAANVEVIDSLAPVAECRDLIIQLDQMDEAFISPSQVNNGSTDNCTIFSFELDTASFDINDLGDNPVVLTVTDQSGNSSTCESIVTVVAFNTPAVARCKDVTLSLDPTSGTSILTPAQIDNGSTGGGMLSFEVIPNVFNCDDIGLDSALLVVNDENSTTDTCQSIVTVLDDTAPDAVCTNIQVNLDDNGMVSVEAEDINLGSSDNCSVASLELDTTMFTCNDLGENLVTLTVTDQSGNSSECIAIVTVEDNIQPLITCKNVVINLQIAGLPADTLTISQLATATDNCAGLTITASQLIFDCSDLGLNTVLMTATDADNNSAVCQATVTVRDVPLNNPLCKNTTVQLDALGQGDIEATDVLTTIPVGVCNPMQVTVSETDFNCADLGLNTVGVNITNGIDYDFNCSAQVTVVDQVAPVAECKDITVSLNNSGNASIMPLAVDDGSTDNCSVTNRLLSRTMFNCNDAGTTVPVTLTVTDQSGNSDVCTANVTVDGSNVIVAECKNVAISLDINGSASITPQMINDGSSVGCGTMMLALSQTSFTCDDIGNQQVVLTVTNGFGASESCTATVSVSDDLPPLLTCADVTLNLDLSGNTTLDPTEAVDPFNTFDNCGDVQLLEVSPFAFDCSDAGAPVAFALSAVDENGNTANCAGTVTVVAPVGLIPFLEFVVTPESGPGQMDGAALVQVIGGSGAFEYEWSTGSSNTFITNLSGGEYCITVTDLNTECQVEQCVDVPVLTPTNISISGIVETEVGLPVRSVNVRLFGPPNDSTLTPSAGTYSFDNLPSGLDWEVSPYKDINDKNGVTTFDLVLISQHILQVFTLDSPYKLIAADANSDNKISTLDILDLRLLILQILDKLPNNTSWRFIDADYVFSKPDDPFIDTFPETIMLNDLTQSAKEVDFIGIKIGDVDLSADPLLFTGGTVTENRDGEQTRGIGFTTADVSLESRTTIEVPVNAAAFRELLGYQMTIDFNPEVLALEGIIPTDALDLTQDHFGYRYLEDGLISANWFSGTPQSVDDGTELFRLVFSVDQAENLDLSDVLRFSSGLLSSEAYAKGMAAPLQLVLRYERNSDNNLQMYTPRPNPFKDVTVLGFDLPEAQSLELRVHDASGRLIFSSDIEGVRGYNEWTIEGDRLPEAGMYFFHLEGKAGIATGRILKID